jgi:hypothetical protein
MALFLFGCDAANRSRAGYDGSNLGLVRGRCRTWACALGLGSKRDDPHREDAEWHPQARRVIITSGVVATVLIAGAPDGVRMIYCAAVEGFVVAAAVGMARIVLRERRLRRRFSSGDGTDKP